VHFCAIIISTDRTHVIYLFYFFLRISIVRFFVVWYATSFCYTNITPGIAILLLPLEITLFTCWPIANHWFRFSTRHATCSWPTFLSTITCDTAITPGCPLAYWTCKNIIVSEGKKVKTTWLSRHLLLWRHIWCIIKPIIWMFVFLILVFNKFMLFLPDGASMDIKVHHKTFLH
jgi:hypothetical protein